VPKINSTLKTKNLMPIRYLEFPRSGLPSTIRTCDLRLRRIRGCSKIYVFQWFTRLRRDCAINCAIDGVCSPNPSTITHPKSTHAAATIYHRKIVFSRGSKLTAIQKSNQFVISITFFRNFNSFSQELCRWFCHPYR
jgi:hypothetical protein